ncbi:MAG: SDR family NAD(P)-dependent oxidoreductase, partial [Steroidobacteraceae bacterium]
MTFDHTVAVITGAATGIGAATARMMAAGSSVNVASAAAKQAVVGTSMYAASKAPVIAFTRTVAGELKGLRIRINAVA